MISKKRLKTLIKQKATIYFVYHGNVDWKEGKYKNDFILCEDYVSIYWTTRSHQIKYEELFETEEDAEWYNEFGNIARTETLTLPTWEEFNKLIETGDTLKFLGKDGLTYILGGWDICEKSINIYLENDDSRFGFSYPLTKENYIEACRMCKDLFLWGEE